MEIRRIARSIAKVVYRTQLGRSLASAIYPALISRKIFKNEVLLPEQWRSGLDPRLFRIFNPSILQSGDGYILCYRVVDPETTWRRVAICRLSNKLEVVPGSVVPLSDMITFADSGLLDERARTWHADPRLFRLRGKTYVSWNDGNNKPRNHQFLLEIHEPTLGPAGAAREILLEPARSQIEKNWTFFESGGAVWCLYALSPLIVARVDLDSPDKIVCSDANAQGWANDYEKRFGILRNGGQPSSWGNGNSYLSVAHSSYRTRSGLVYEVAFCEFSKTAPFRMKRSSAKPFLLHQGRMSFRSDRLNSAVARVIYPTGNVTTDRSLIVSYGINDERCGIASVPRWLVGMSLRPVHSTFGTAPAENVPAKVAVPESTPSGAQLPLFWWEAKGKKFVNEPGSVRFGVGNFGDVASYDLVQRISGVSVRQAMPSERKLLAVGSVLHLARNGDVIWGSGFKSPERVLPAFVKDIDVRAVRGPLTLQLLAERGIDTSKVERFFDPGALIASVYRGELERHLASGQVRKRPLCIIPHYRDDAHIRRTYPSLVEHMVSVDCTPLDMAKSMLGAERVISSSLHGIIFAESLGIPAQWLQETGGEADFKYLDYYYGTDRREVKRFDRLDEAVKAEPMELPFFDSDKILATFPRDAVSDFMHPGIPGGVSVPLNASRKDELGNWVTFADPVHIDKNGIWISGPETGMRVHLADRARSVAAVRITMRPFNPGKWPSPQACTVWVEGCEPQQISWAKAAQSSASVVFPVSGQKGAVDVFFSTQRTAPINRLRSIPEQFEVGVCVESVEAYTTH